MKKKIYLIIIIIIVLFALGVVGSYFFFTGKVNNNSKVVEFEVVEGSTFSSIAHSLKKQNLIKSELFYRIYLKLNEPDGLQAGVHHLSSDMDVKKLVSKLQTVPSGRYTNVTFKEGINMRRVIKLITENTNITEEEILNKLQDKEYLKSLIDEYWFLTDDILNDDIYYSLEGYLFPDTYQIAPDNKLEDIFKMMLDNTAKKLDIYKDRMVNNKRSIHEIMTLASIIELEAANSEDRNGVAGVFYNRLDGGWTLGSDVTTYYGVKVDVSERDLYQAEIETPNNYNTRHASMAGKLPVSPICNPSIVSIEAAINPTEHNYYYFVADKNKKTYFSATYNEHVSTVSKLKNEGLWFTY